MDTSPAPTTAAGTPFGGGAETLHDWFSSGAAADDDRAVLHELVDGVGAVVLKGINVMGAVIMHNVVSVDGFIADDKERYFGPVDSSTCLKTRTR